MELNKYTIAHSYIYIECLRDNGTEWYEEINIIVNHYDFEEFLRENAYLSGSYYNEMLHPDHPQHDVEIKYSYNYEDYITLDISEEIMEYVNYLFKKTAI